MNKPLFDQLAHSRAIRRLRTPKELQPWRVAWGKVPAWAKWVTVALVIFFISVAAGAAERLSYVTLSYAQWHQLVRGQERLALRHPGLRERELAAMIAHLAREGYRLGEADGLAQCAADDVGGKP